MYCIVALLLKCPFQGHRIVEMMSIFCLILLKMNLYEFKLCPNCEFMFQTLFHKKYQPTRCTVEELVSVWHKERQRNIVCI